MLCGVVFINTGILFIPVAVLSVIYEAGDSIYK